MSAVFISRGMTVAVPPGGLTFTEDDSGELHATLTLHVRFDVCPTWIELAIKHLKDAHAKAAIRADAWSRHDEEQKQFTLEQEFESSMQAIVAIATAVDGFYSMVKSHISIPDNLSEKWRTGRTARYSQIAEVLKRAFKFKPDIMKILRKNLREIYRVRDHAVHPSAEITAPIFRADLGVGVEWRFAYFHACNADLLVNAGSEIIWECVKKRGSNNAALCKYLDGLNTRLMPLFSDNPPLVPPPHPLE